jgi:hypothetical protein
MKNITFFQYSDIYIKINLMNKNDIRIRLKEELEELFILSETEKKEDKEDKEDKKEKNTDKGKKDYSDVRRAFEKLGGPSMVDVMKLTGISDDEKGVNRSLFRKKVKQIKNKDTGSIYQFDDEELNGVRAALDIKK